MAFHALWMHGAWEAAQCALFYDMNGASIASGIIWMVGATLADVFFTLLLVRTMLGLSTRNGAFSRSRAAFWLIGSGGAIALLIEAGAQAAGWWRYSSVMPIISVFEWRIGVLPLLQMAFLPLVCLLLTFDRLQIGFRSNHREP